MGIYKVMGNEAGKNQYRLIPDSEYEMLFRGQGIDIGCGRWPILPNCDTWDIPQGDAQYMEGIKPESYDWVHSSHCLEHMKDPYTALCHWWKLVKTQGHLIVTIPCYFLYEHKQWPSRFNGDHKHKFSIIPHAETITITDLFRNLSDAQVRWIRTNDTEFNYEDKISDQTCGKAQAEIEFVLKKINPFWTQ